MYVTDIRNPKSQKFLGEAGLTYSGANTTSPIQVAAQGDARDTQLVQQMHYLSQLIYNAKQRGDVPEVQRLLDQFRPLADEYRERGSIGVSPFDTFIVSTGDWIVQAGKTVGGAVATVGWGAGKALLPFALIGAGLLYFKGKL